MNGRPVVDTGAFMAEKNEQIAVVGLGYVGLPVAVAFARKFPGTIGFDVDAAKIAELAKGIDRMSFPGAPATARMLEAGVACVRGGDVVTPLRIALEAALTAEFLVYTPFLRRRLGEAVGGSEGAALIAAGDAEAVAQGWQIPERGAEMCIPRG